MLSNNDILKKLRVAHKLRDENIVDILKLVDFEITKGALGDMFRDDQHPNFVEAGDQILRKFLDGLIIHLRGVRPKKEPIKDISFKSKKPPIKHISFKRKREK